MRMFWNLIRNIRDNMRDYPTRAVKVETTPEQCKECRKKISLSWEKLMNKVDQNRIQPLEEKIRRLSRRLTKYEADDTQIIETVKQVRGRLLDRSEREMFLYLDSIQGRRALQEIVKNAVYAEVLNLKRESRTSDIVYYATIGLLIKKSATFWRSIYGRN